MFKQGPTRHWAMAHRILNMPVAVKNCHNVLQTCLLLSTGQCRHVCSRLFFRSEPCPTTGWRQGHGRLTSRPWQKCIEFNISWKIIDRGKSFDSVSRTCNLCTTEKLYLLRNPELCSLNTNNELGSYCRHQKRLFHSNLKQWEAYPMSDQLVS